MDEPKKLVIPVSARVKAPLTLNQFLKNPTMVHSAFFSSRERIKEDLMNRYRDLRKKHGKFPTLIYKFEGTYVFHVRVPSEKYDKINFDVVFQFIQIPGGIATNLIHYSTKMFSNSPNFTFTYTYVMNDLGLLSPLLKDKCNPKALTEKPTKRNPIESLGFEKSCYFAGLYLQDMNYLNRLDVDQNIRALDKRSFLAMIKSDNEKLREYNRAKASQNAAKKAPVKKPASKPTKVKAKKK